MAASARYGPLAFRELSLSVLACEIDGDAPRTGPLLLAAFNSRRLLAWCERTLFATPYRYGDLCLETQETGVLVQLRQERSNPSVVMRFSPSGSRPDPPATGPKQTTWKGPIFLPAPRRTWFYAKLAGLTETFPFDGKGNLLTMSPSPEVPILGEIVASTFLPQEWTLRHNATHARSKTYRA